MRTFWIDRTIDVAIVSGANHLAVSLFSAATLEAFQLTIVRTIVNLDIWHLRDVVGVERVSLGIGLASEQGFAAVDGEADPGEETQSPIRGWVWRGQYVIGGAQTELRTVRVEKDIRAMRKLENGVYYIGLRSNNIDTASFDPHVTGMVRTLVGHPEKT